MRRVLLMVVLACFPAAALAEGEDVFAAMAATQPDLPPGIGQGQGVLHRVDVGLGLVFISHSAIPELGLPVMTRDLKLASRAMAATLMPGMAVEFRLQQRGQNDYVIIEIKPLVQNGINASGW